MPELIIGVHLLETLTSGMYSDPKVIFREYVQNSCDQIDEAVERGIIDIDAATVNIYLEDDSICIEDNATGIPASEFKKKLYSIGDSDKSPDKNRGFRGIGHWCGFAHCDKLTFTAKAQGETVESVMTCNAGRMREMMAAHRNKRAQYTIEEILDEVTSFSEKKTEDSDLHYFKVEMNGIRESKELCNKSEIRKYLSFVAPVGYATEFPFRKKIREHAKEIGYPIPEYHIYVDGEEVLKKYSKSLDMRAQKTGEVSDVRFKEFRDKSGLVAWMWFGISEFEAQIAASNQMRGIRLRSRNIQIGREDALKKLFRESNGRGLYYYIGEVFAISNDLLPDSQRDYFEPGDATKALERLLSDFFNEDLTTIYYEASRVNSAVKAIEKANQSENTPEAGKKAEEAWKTLAKIENKIGDRLDKDESDVVGNTLVKIIEKKKERLRPSVVPSKQAINEEDGRESEKAVAPPIRKSDEGGSRKKVPENMFVLLNRIREIIRENADGPVAEAIIAKIESEFQNVP